MGSRVRQQLSISPDWTICSGAIRAASGLRAEAAVLPGMVNAALSFTYMLLTSQIQSAMETVGLDPAAGYLHTLRPGRPSFALDLIEELRAPLCDRFVISLFNKGQLSASDFEKNEEAVYLNERGRRTLLSAWQRRKQEEITHPFLGEKVQIGMIPYAQAMLFARVLRGDLDAYPPFAWR